MGTNYYLQKKSGTCQTCGHCSEDPKHIGKSSGGWCFSLHVYPEENITTVTIVNEYGETISPRHRVDGKHCVGHGEGTWDYIIGEFS